MMTWTLGMPSSSRSSNSSTLRSMENRRGLGGVGSWASVVQEGCAPLMTQREGGGLPYSTPGKHAPDHPSTHPALPFPLRGSWPPTSYQTVEAVKGLQPTDTVLQKEGTGERGGLGWVGGGTRLENFPILVPWPWEGGKPCDPTSPPRSAQFVILG